MFRCLFPSRTDQVGYGYSCKAQLGSGCSGCVYLAKDNVSGLLVAVKACKAGAPAWQEQMARREASMLVASQHVSLVVPYSLRLTHTSLQLVLQHCSGGTLEAYCRQHKVTEDLACYFLHQLVAVLEHLHSSMIAYRDLKLQNVLLRSKPSRKSPPRLVVCDLGTAKTLTGHAFKCETFVGTPGFMSPQVLASMFNTMATADKPDAAGAAAGGDSDCSHHSSTSKSSHTYDGRKADIWALGALLHYMLHRQLPYGYDSFAPLLPPQEALLTLLQLENEHTWKDAAGAHGLRPISPEAQDLLDQLLHPVEAQRISIQKIKQHPWYLKPLPQQYKQALEQMQAEQTVYDVASQVECHQRSKQLAVRAVDKLFELSKCPVVLQRLQQQGRCLSVPLGGMRPGADAEAAAEQQLEQVLAQLEEEAVEAGLKPSSSSSETRSRLSVSSNSTSSVPSVLVQQQEQTLARALSGASSWCGNHMSGAAAKNADVPLARDDTCYLVATPT